VKTAVFCKINTKMETEDGTKNGGQKGFPGLKEKGNFRRAGKSGKRRPASLNPDRPGVVEVSRVCPCSGRNHMLKEEFGVSATGRDKSGQSTSQKQPSWSQEMSAPCCHPPPPQKGKWITRKMDKGVIAKPDTKKGRRLDNDEIWIGRGV